ncbi:cyanophycin synthetase [Nakamurella endophytica]|uniref:Cyanophycin synthetase n=1 Tax=Nakamurella endophytica TaxID=1748367 RepID=A0A917TDI6_9ACTN|nr:cyanophycin synthetase [Nakamurella endophytica]GGM18263.1 cyanophycin synthetase [Nakamurella endophytica]
MTDVPATDAVPAASREVVVRESRVYRGPNYWSYEPAVHFVVDIGGLEDTPTDRLPGFTEMLLAALPGLQDHQCSRGRDGGFVERLHEGTWAGHVTEHVALELQRTAGHEITRGKTRSTGERGVYHVIFGYLDETVGTMAGRLAVRLVNALVAESDRTPPPEPDFDFRAEHEAFLRTSQRVAFGPSTQAILDEAIARDIPWQRLNSASLVQLGHGVHQQRIRATMTSQTSSLAVDIASDKELTNRLLAAAGLPVPASDVVRTADDAVRVARRIGYPVVVKPLDGNHGRGVAINLTTPEAVRAAFTVAYDESRRGHVLVESFITGRDYRVLVVGGNMVAIAERVPAHVLGDGTSTVAELVEATNADPRRGVGHEKVLTRIAVDDAAVALVREQGYAMTDVPPRGEMVKLALTGNMSTGGISIDRTFEAHPDNVDIAEEAARVVGLDIAGIDFLCPDITQPVRETGGGICEVNAAPGFRMHSHPTVGEPQYVAKPVVDLLFPPGTPARIPIVAVTGTNGKTTTTRMIGHIFKGMGRKVGMTSTDGVVIDDRLVIRADASGPKSARMVLQNPRVDFAVFEVARGGILREGLGYSRNDVAVVLNVAPDHLGLRGIDTVEQLARVKQVIVEAVPRNGAAVLNADDPLVAGMRRVCAGEVVWFSLDPDNRMISDHCRRGGKAVVLERGELGELVVLVHGRRRMPLAYTHLLPATFNGKARFNVQNAMAAAGAAYCAGAHLHDIRAGLRSFTPSYYQAPGRMNLTEVHGVKVVVDYCHNAPAMVALGDFVDRYFDDVGPIERPQRIGVIATAGDRRDQDMRDLGREAARHFDVMVVREDLRLRGRQPGETAALIVEGAREAQQAGRRLKEIDVVLDEIDATRSAVERANSGDLVVLCVDRARAVWDELQRLGTVAQAGAAADFEEP